MQHFDVLIVGAGISGIGSACHLQSKCPDKTFAILEARAEYGARSGLQGDVLKRATG